MLVTRNYARDGLGSPEVVAYLWIAIDAGMNIILTGSRHGIRRSLRAIGFLIPSYHKVVANVGDMSEWLWGNANVMCAANAANGSLGFCPDRMVVERLGNGDAYSLFGYAMRGHPFLAGMPDVDDGMLVRRLLGRPYSVNSEMVSKLDISVSVSALGKVEGIREFHWFERGEAEMDECDAELMNKTTRIVSAGALDKSSLDSSKAIYEYAKASCTSKEAGDSRTPEARRVFYPGQRNEDKRLPRPTKA